MIGILKSGLLFLPVLVVSCTTKRAPTAFQTGVYYFDRGQFEEAVRAFSKANGNDGLFNLGLSYLKLGKYREAESTYRDLLTHSPGHGEALANLGHALAGQQKHTAAAASFQKALQTSPENPDLYCAFVHYLLEKAPQNDIGQVNGLINRALNLNSRHGPAYLFRGKVHLQQENTQAAAADFQQALEIDSGNHAARMALAKLRLEGGNSRQALKLYLAAASESPESARVWLGAGRAYLAEGHFSKAIASLNRARALGSNAKDIEVSMAQAQLGLASSSLQTLKQALAKPDLSLQQRLAIEAQLAALQLALQKRESNRAASKK